MSIFKKDTLIESFPAYDIVEREADHTGYVQITSTDILGAKSNRGYYRTYTPGSAVSYALQYNEDPIAAYNHCIEHGHTTHWINQNASVISSTQQARKVLVNVTIGMKVVFEGLRATIETDHNNNLKFVQVVV